MSKLNNEFSTWEVRSVQTKRGFGINITWKFDPNRIVVLRRFTGGGGGGGVIGSSIMRLVDRGCDCIIQSLDYTDIG